MVFHIRLHFLLNKHFNKVIKKFPIDWFGIFEYKNGNKNTSRTISKITKNLCKLKKYCYTIFFLLNLNEWISETLFIIII